MPESPYNESFSENPGLELKKFLETLYPLNSENDENSLDFLSEMDAFLRSEGRLRELVYRSLICYLIRRLINTAESIRRKYQSEDNPDTEFIKRLREFLTYKIDIEESSVEKLIAILQSCLRIKNQRRKKNIRKKFLKDSYPGLDELLCYICGKALHVDEVSVEHMWPRSMGGSYSKENLKPVCKICNELKKNFINGSDFHYEQVSLSVNENDESFVKEFEKVYKVALCSHNGYRCVMCGKLAESVGRLKFIRRDEEDSWHFLNIDTMCTECEYTYYNEE